MNPSEPEVAEASGPMLESYVAAARQAYESMAQSGDDVAEVILESIANEPHLRYTTSAAIRGLAGLKYVDPTGDPVVALTVEPGTPAILAGAAPTEPSAFS